MVGFIAYQTNNQPPNDKILNKVYQYGQHSSLKYGKQFKILYKP